MPHEHIARWMVGKKPAWDVNVKGRADNGKPAELTVTHKATQELKDAITKALPEHFLLTDVVMYTDHIKLWFLGRDTMEIPTEGIYTKTDLITIAQVLGKMQPSYLPGLSEVIANRNKLS